MSEVINPPDYYFTGINFNPAFYAEDAGGLSQETANALYLRKTVPDTATAVETFSTGIITPSVTSTGKLDIIVPATLSTDVLNVGVVNRTISGQVHHYSDGDNCVSGAGVHLNNGLNNKSATNIANGDASSSPNGDGPVNIKSGNNNTGTITIGKSTNFFTGNVTTTTLNGNVNIASTGAGNIAIGSLTGSTETTILGTTNINANTSSATNIGLDGTLTIKGIVNINGVGSTNNQLITIGNPTASGQTTLASPSTTISGTANCSSIQSLTTATNMNIGTTLTSTAEITVGSTPSTTRTNIRGGQVSINPLMDGAINIGRIGSRNTAINIGDGSSGTSLSEVNINSGASSQGQTNINTGFNSSGQISIGNSAGLAGSTQSCTIRSGQINIGTVTPTDNTRNITIGATDSTFDSNTALNGKTTISKLTLSAPITPTYAYGASITANQIGHVVTSLVPVDFTLPAGLTVKTTVATLTGLTAGRWLFNALCMTKPVVNNNMMPVGLLIKTVGTSPTETLLAYSVTMMPTSSAIPTSINISWIEDVEVGTTATFRLQMNMNQGSSTYSGFTIGSLSIANAGYLQGIRIA